MKIYDSNTTKTFALHMSSPQKKSRTRSTQWGHQKDVRITYPPWNSHLNMDGWKTIVCFRDGRCELSFKGNRGNQKQLNQIFPSIHFSGAMYLLVSGRVFMTYFVANVGFFVIRPPFTAQKFHGVISLFICTFTPFESTLITLPPERCE